MKKLEACVRLEDKAVEVLLLDQVTSKSSKIKALFEGGFEVKEIAGLLGIRYNFAYNVIQNHVIMNDIATTNTKKDTKKDEVGKLFNDGKTLVEVARELKMNYNYVWKLHKEWEAEVIKEAAAEEARLAALVVADVKAKKEKKVIGA